MNIDVVGSGNDCRLVFEGALTHEYSRQLEDRVIDLMRHHPSLKIDLSGVCEIDLFGIHFLGVMRNLGGSSVDIIAASPVVDRALTHWPSTSRGTSLGRFVRRREYPQSASA